MMETGYLPAIPVDILTSINGLAPLLALGSGSSVPNRISFFSSMSYVPAFVLIYSAHSHCNGKIRDLHSWCELPECYMPT
jgi:hypothetical protein